MFRIKIIACLLAICTLLSAQKQPEHKKKFYLSKEGSLYCNKSLPVYFWISTSPNENAEKHRLQSETTPKYSNPLYFDTEGRNTYRSPSAVDTITKQIVEPKIDVEYQIYADGIAPVTKWKVDSKILYEKNKVYYTNSSILSLTATDELSGIDAIMYSLDSAEYQKYNSTIMLNSEKEFTIKYYAFDNTGNDEKASVLKLCIDKSAPVSELKFIGDKYNEIISGNTYLEITANDNLSGVKKIMFSLDDTIYRHYNGKLFSGNIPQGQHTIHYYSIDNVGNNEQVKALD